MLSKAAKSTYLKVLSSGKRISSYLSKYVVDRIKYKPNQREISELLNLIANPPRPGKSSKDWIERVSKLIADNALSKIAQEDLANILAGLILYRLDGTIPEASQQSLVNSYCRTNGLAQELAHAAIMVSPVKSDKINLQDKSLLSNTSEADCRHINKEMQMNGYSIRPNSFSAKTLKEINSEILNFTFRRRGSRQDYKPIELSHQRLQGVWDANPDELAKSKIFNQICNDPTMIFVASKYLRSQVVPICTGLWFTFPSEEATSKAAQLYHYDLDTLRWIKVFIYLNDVNSNNGPHEYIQASHKPGSKPTEILMRGYERIQDAEIQKYFQNRRLQITGPAGTIIFADTRCFHKGTNPVEGYRTIFEVTYAPSELGLIQR